MEIINSRTNLWIWTVWIVLIISDLARLGERSQSCQTQPYVWLSKFRPFERILRYLESFFTSFWTSCNCCMPSSVNVCVLLLQVAHRVSKLILTALLPKHRRLVLNPNSADPFDSPVPRDQHRALRAAFFAEHPS